MTQPFDLCDEFGPAKVLHLSDPRHGLKAIVVVDNVAAGPAIGGVRMAADADLDECFRLARAMTLKNASAGLAHGGGKSVIIADPERSTTEKADLVRAFARAIADVHDYIPGPDMGTNELYMAYVKDEIGRAVGLPQELGGIPLDDIGATGYGLTVSVEAACAFTKMSLTGARVAIQGFGAVGRHAARFLCERGARLVAASDSQACIVNADGLSVDDLMRIKAAGGTVGDYGHGQRYPRDHVIEVECDVWIPAARPDIIRADNVGRLNTKIVAQGANIGVTADAERILHERGVLSIPDFIANAGGVICAAVEYQHGTRAQAFDKIEETVRDNVQQMLNAARSEGQLPRDVASAIAIEKVRRAMSTRR